MKNTGLSRRAWLTAAGAAMIPAFPGMAAASTLRTPSRPYLIAHRGGVIDDMRTENSLAALREASVRGYTHVEVDVRSTRDGRAVCLHDRSLKRTTGIDVNVDDVTLDELHRLVSGATVPAFDTFARMSAAWNIALMVDVKKTPEALVPALAGEIETVLRRHDLIEGAFLIGSEPVIVRIPAPARLKWRESFDRFQSEVLTVGGDAARYFAFNSPRDFTPGDVAAFRRAGVDVVVTVNLLHYVPRDPIALGESDLAYARELGVDGYQIDAEYEAFTRKLISARPFGAHSRSR